MLINFKDGIFEYYIDIDDKQIYLKCKYVPDSDEILIFIHGLACSSESFRNVFDFDYFPSSSLLLIDLVGFGKSSKPDDFGYLMEDQARLIEELISSLHQKKIHIVAHSMGGTIALLLPDEIMNRVVSFSNIEGNLVSEDCGLFSRGVISVPFEDYKNTVFKQQLIENMNHPQFRFEETTPSAVYKSAESLVRWSDSGGLLVKFKTLNCRKSYFYGEENKNMPVLLRLDSIPLFMIHKSGHAMMTENPDEFYKKLAEFISRN
ncbi:MAG: alpha/beta hydrolase [bacterium]